MGEIKITKMEKPINNPRNLTPELLEGFAEAYKELVTLGENHMIINNKPTETDGATIVTQGDSGHEPAISEFAGKGMVGISAMGDIFAAPGPQACLDAIKLADEGKGALYIILDHTGDMPAGNLTMEKCAKGGLNVVKVVTQKDIAGAPRPNIDDRRGLVGHIPTYRIAGAATAEEKSLEEVAATAQWLVDNIATLTVAVSGTTHSATGGLFADPGEDEVEIGMRRRGEGGDGHQTMKSVDETAGVMLDSLLADLDIREGEKIMLIFNGTGVITLMELFIIYRRHVLYLKEKDIKTVANYMSEPFIVQEQAGFQMFIARMGDEPLRYWNVPCNAPCMRK